MHSYVKEYLAFPEALGAVAGTSAPDPPERSAVDRIPGWLDSGVQVTLLTVIVAAGVALWVAGLATDPGILRLFGAFFVVYPGLLLLGLVDAPWMSERVDRFIEEWARDAGKGFYGLMAASVFVSKEAVLLVDRINAIVGGGPELSQAISSWLLDFGMESLMNALHAVIWPAQVFPVFGLAAGGLLVAVCWGAFWLGTRLFSSPAWLLEEEGE